ncbi:MAG TPA: DUF6542 domain-containing protein [Jatrophihabitans sp.]
MADDDWGAPTTVQSAAVQDPELDTSAPPPGPGDTAQWRLPSEKDEAGGGPAWRNLPAWAALLVLIGIAAVGGIIDIAAGKQLSGIFNWGIVIATIAAVLLVRRAAIFPVVIAPPLVYAGASAVMIYARSGGLNDRRVLYDSAANWLVYGFPTMAAATAIVLVVAGVRLIAHK